eukprot:3617839-Rhodomonas_salina.2
MAGPQFNKDALQAFHTRARAVSDAAGHQLVRERPARAPRSVVRAVRLLADFPTYPSCARTETDAYLVALAYLPTYVHVQELRYARYARTDVGRV